MILSIIVPAYNAEPFIHRCISSILVQHVSNEECEVIIVNDGSVDGTQTIIEDFAQKYSFIKVINKPNGGLSSARNAGMKLAKGEYFFFVDSDDWLVDDTLDWILLFLEREHPDALAICPGDFIDGQVVQRYRHPDEWKTGVELLKTDISPCAPFIVWNSNVLQRYNITFFEGIFHEDSEFTPRALYYCNRVYAANVVAYVVYPTSGSITRSVNAKKSFDLVNVVCPHLYMFADHVPVEEQYVFYNLVSKYLNNALFHIRLCDVNDQIKLNTLIASDEKLVLSLLRSSVLKYRFEGVLMKCLPNHPLLVYKTLQFIHGR